MVQRRAHVNRTVEQRFPTFGEFHSERGLVGQQIRQATDTACMMNDGNGRSEIRRQRMKKVNERLQPASGKGDRNEMRGAAWRHDGSRMEMRKNDRLGPLRMDEARAVRRRTQRSTPIKCAL